ncbi:MAG: hypothetical protein LV480_08615 [Methylacidiphilales bacterium]|nr:hypothetical protein [Candidatus Methylacidiphilales bacterium]
MPDTRLILHVKGTEAETTELPKEVVRAAISQGQITHSQLIWIPADNAWKQVRELPDLLPNQEMAPSPTRKVPVPRPKVAEPIIPESPTGPVARVASAGAPRARVAAAGTPRVQAAAPQTTLQVRVAPTPILVRSTGDLVVKDEEESHLFKWICIGLGVFILVVLGGNFLLVDEPLRSNISGTPYANVMVQAHLGAFIQPNVVAIHVWDSSAITPDNLTAFLVALAHSTPDNPITHNLLDRVTLTTGWMAQYSFSGYSWKQLGGMQDEDEAQIKEFLIAQMDDAGGQPLAPESTQNQEAQQAMHDKIWDKFVAQFTAKH